MKQQNMSITCLYAVDGPEATKIIENSLVPFFKKRIQVLPDRHPLWYTKNYERSLISGEKICM